MEIKIDTSKDSKEDIKKTIAFLQKLVDDDSYTPSSTSSDGSVFDMFGDDDKKEDDEPKEKPDDERPPRVEIIEW